MIQGLRIFGLPGGVGTHYGFHGIRKIYKNSKYAVNFFCQNYSR